MDEMVYVESPATLVGQEAPDFTAKAVIGQGFEDYTLSERTWKQQKYTVLWFYPKDFTFVCPTELLAFNEKLKEFHDRGCEVVSVSVDSEFVHLAWKNTPPAEGGVGDIQYPMVADIKREIAEDYGVLSEGGVAFRGLFLIDANGIVRHCVINDMPLGRSVDEALRMVDALQFHEEHGEVCPAGWKPGSATIKPTPEESKEYFRNQGAIEVKP